jgi:ferredoxin
VPERFHIHTVPTPAKFDRVGKFGPSDWREDCSRCKNCVKLRCLYHNYESESEYNRDPSRPVEPVFECKACLSCVQGCTKGLLSLTINPEFQSLGDPYWRPDIIATTWDQSEAGRIPVSGAGYRGPFSGPGFDSMWTDMSEIVRPTRDGIHGREYISTSVDIGSKPMQLNFDDNGVLKNPSSLIDVQMPVLLDLIPWGDPSEAIAMARVSAAASLHTLAVVPATLLRALPAKQRSAAVPLFDGEDVAGYADILGQVKMAEVADGPNCLATVKKLQESHRALLVGVRVALRSNVAQRALELHESGVSVIHLCANYQGREIEAEKPRFIKDVLREVHGVLVKHGVRDEVTLIGSGGIALAEHVAKAIICGADMVGADVALLVSLGCRVCSHGHGEGCPARIPAVDAAYAAQRMVNLMGAWHNQLIEVLGAMGIREVRRLRGEVGRAMFLEDLERDAFKELVRSA